MATLPELVATPVTITLKGHEFTAPPLTILQNADVSATMETLKAERGEMYAMTYWTVKFVETFLRGSYPDITEDYVARLLTGEDADRLADVVRTIGGFDPKAPTGEPSSPDSLTEPAGDSVTSVN